MRTVGYGTVTVTATTENGLTASTELAVYEDTQDFNLPEDLSVEYGDAIRLYALDVVPEYYPQMFTWTVEPAGAASINGDLLTPVVNEDMQLTVTATSWDGVSRSQTVQVYGLDDSSMFKLPAALKTIDTEAFVGCIMTSVVVPEGCKSIGNRAFADSENLRRVQIPESVTSIADDAFEGSTNLRIVAPAGSYAERYAEEKEITFIAK